jgi:hypothetical protein
MEPGPALSMFDLLIPVLDQGAGSVYRWFSSKSHEPARASATVADAVSKEDPDGRA